MKQHIFAVKNELYIMNVRNLARHIRTKPITDESDGAFARQCADVLAMAWCVDASSALVDLVCVDLK